MSVVRATCDGARFIDEQLRRLARQTALLTELIVSDDVSIDETLDIVARFAEDAPFAAIVRRNPHALGYGENFLTAVGLATGDPSALYDQDDIWLPAKVEVALQTLTEAGAQLYVHRAAVVRTDDVVANAAR